MLMLVVALVAALLAPGGAIAAEPADDYVEIVSLTTRVPAAELAPDTIPFQAVVNYRLRSTSDGFLLLLPYQDNATTATQQSSAEMPVHAGTGQVSLNIDYTARPGVRTLTLMVALFKSEQKLLTWVSTKPFDLAPWPGRAAFNKAMAARTSLDYSGAEQYLTRAIEVSPEMASYYYWRGDTRTYLNEYDAAIDDFTRSIALMPEDRASYLGRGIAVLWKGDPQAAIADLSFAVDHQVAGDRVSAFAYRVRGTAYAALKQPAQAISDYQAYLALLPGAPDRAEVESWIADLS
jgi:hypothetical protein